MKHIINGLMILLFTVVLSTISYMVYISCIDKGTIGLYAVCSSYLLYSAVLIYILHRIKKEF